MTEKEIIRAATEYKKNKRQIEELEKANERIQKAFDALYTDIKSLNTSLCIGYTKMLSIAAYDLKLQ